MALPDGLILGIENSNPDRGPGGFRGEVALAEVGPSGTRVLARERLRPASDRDDDLMSGVDRAFVAAGREPHSLGAVAVSIGPGGFTGLRIAAVTAKALAESTGAAVFGVATSDALIRRVGSDVRSVRRVAVCLAWKGESVWCTRYGPGESRVEGALMPFGGVFEGDSAWALVADARLAKAFSERGLTPAGAVVLTPEYDALAVIEAAAGVSATDPALLVPLYPREPEAVTKWRALHPRV